jgi:hypothetical protein
MSASHACDACGASGETWDTPYPLPAHANKITCHVCLGAGRISDRMPVADALADAETLWRVARELVLLPDLYAATNHGWVARDCCLRRSAIAALEARTAAHAALRAVPGLRGEDGGRS